VAIIDILSKVSIAFCVTVGIFLAVFLFSSSPVALWSTAEEFANYKDV
jgi:hypothetical protein